MSSSSDLMLVTAASGKTGRACVSRLLAHGANVRALVRRQDAADELKASGVQEVVIGDLFDAEVLRIAMQGISRILHICPPMHWTPCEGWRSSRSRACRMIPSTACRCDCASGICGVGSLGDFLALLLLRLVLLIVGFSFAAAAATVVAAIEDSRCS